MAGGASVLVGQSGVGKSTLLNSIEPGLKLRVGEVSTESQKGKHTTTTAQLLPLSSGGYVVDTPGIRQFQLWDVIPEEVAGCYRDLRSALRWALVQVPQLHAYARDGVRRERCSGRRPPDARRYESYCHLLAGDIE